MLPSHRAPQPVQSLGSCLRSLVTFAHKSRWLPRDVDPMWLMSYSVKGEFQGQAIGFVPRDLLPADEQCEALFAALVSLNEPTWALAMRLKHRSGARWGVLIALPPAARHRVRAAPGGADPPSWSSSPAPIAR